MHLLIDGYNLIYAAAISARSNKGRGLERSRLALMNFVAETVDEPKRAGIVIVFDAAGAPPGLPPLVEHRGLQVRFSKGYPSADELLEELIDAESAPRRLIVVSSDHRIQRAARRRRATAIDSDVWYHEALHHRNARGREKPQPSEPRGSPTADEVQYWLRCFDDADTSEQKPEAGSADNIFPPGYAEDIEDDTT
jgi:hypothetical protein